MTPQDVLAHFDSGAAWPEDHALAASGDLAEGYRIAHAVRVLRERRGEAVAGHKLGWTNPAHWTRLGVTGPMWGSLHTPGVVHCDGHATLALPPGLLPRLEPEIVVGWRHAPPPAATCQDLFESLEWIAPGFEIVQSHRPDWRYAPAQTIADSAVHAALVVGPRASPRELAPNGAALAALLAQASVRLTEGDAPRAQGHGSNVLGSPLQALQAFVRRADAPPFHPAQLVTTGTWTDAQSLAPGQTWEAVFDLPLAALRLSLR